MIREWKIFLWALMHSPQRCEIEIRAISFCVDIWTRNPTIIGFTASLCFPPEIRFYIPYETRRAYEIRVEGAKV